MGFKEDVGKVINMLVKETDEYEIIKKLQTINGLILDYKIKADNDFIIYPIWVEAYYNKEDVFEDDSCHDDGNPPGQFKFRKHCEGRGGVDLYLSDSNEYYLSFLVKLALVKNGNDLILLSQTEIITEINECFERLDTLKLSFSETDLNIDRLRKARCKRIRVGGEYENAELAVCYEDIKPRTYDTLKNKTELYNLR